MLASRKTSRRISLEGDPDYFYYLASAQWHPEDGGIVIRTSGNGVNFAETIRGRLQREMPGASYVTVMPFRDVMGQQMRSWEVGASMFVTFGLLSLVLAAVGLFSVIAYNRRAADARSLACASRSAPRRGTWLDS